MTKIDTRKLSREAQDQLRLQGFRLRRELHLPWREIARILGVSVSTVGCWSRRYNDHGLEGLISKTRGRRPMSNRTLSMTQEMQIRRILIDENPRQMKLAFALWTRRAVMDLIKLIFNIDMPIRTVGLYLQRWGFTPQRPVQRALEKNPAAVDRWLHETYPAIQARAKAEHAIIYWGDETAVAEDGVWLRGYAPAGNAPVLVASTKRHGLSMVSAISNVGMLRFQFIEQAMNANLLIEFMAKLVEDNEKKVFLILDNLKVHHAKIVTAWLAEHRDEIEVFYLPAYSPELNPDEYLNGDLKIHLRSGPRTTTKSGLLRNAASFMRFLSETPDRVRSYFRHPAVRYAA
jgi:transposase